MIPHGHEQFAQLQHTQPLDLSNRSTCRCPQHRLRSGQLEQYGTSTVARRENSCSILCTPFLNKVQNASSGRRRVPPEPVYEYSVWICSRTTTMQMTARTAAATIPSLLRGRTSLTRPRRWMIHSCSCFIPTYIDSNVTATPPILAVQSSLRFRRSHGKQQPFLKTVTANASNNKHACIRQWW